MVVKANRAGGVAWGTNDGDSLIAKSNLLIIFKEVFNWWKWITGLSSPMFGTLVCLLIKKEICLIDKSGNIKSQGKFENGQAVIEMSMGQNNFFGDEFCCQDLVSNKSAFISGVND